MTRWEIELKGKLENHNEKLGPENFEWYTKFAISNKAGITFD